MTKNIKFKVLVARLGLPRPYVMGLLETLWEWAHESGNPALGCADNVEIAAEWPGEKGVLFEALRDGKWIDELDDGTWTIHDYYHHAPRYVRERRRKELGREKKQRKPAQKGAPRAPKSRAGAQNGAPLPAPAPNTQHPTPAPVPSPQPPAAPPPMPAAPAGELATLWAFHCTRKVRGVVADRAEDKTAEFAEMLRQGADAEVLKAAITDAGRDRNEHLWQFRQRMLPRATGPPRAEAADALAEKFAKAKERLGGPAGGPN